GSGLRRGYLSGVASTVLYIFLCAANGIYADAVINVWYSIMGVVGWFSWKQRQGESQTHLVQAMTGQGLVLGLGLGLLAWFFFWFVLKNYTDSSVALWDTTTSALAITAMLWMAAGYRWNWPLWLIINLMSVGLYLHKGMTPTALQYCVFAVLAVRGWWKWTRQTAF
ncbi:MAG: nicotinamide riboside transporter PnuC, partial [Bacteroidota bacterium]